MPETKEYYLLFHTIHDVLRAEKVLSKYKIAFELVPVPRNLSSDCGMSVRTNDNLEEALKYLKGIEVDKCFYFDGLQYTKIG